MRGVHGSGRLGHRLAQEVFPQVAARVVDTVRETKLGAYLEAPPGVGKTQLLSEVFIPCEEGKPTLNIIVGATESDPKSYTAM